MKVKVTSSGYEMVVVVNLTDYYPQGVIDQITTQSIPQYVLNMCHTIYVGELAKALLLEGGMDEATPGEVYVTFPGIGVESTSPRR